MSNNPGFVQPTGSRFCVPPRPRTAVAATLAATVAASAKRLRAVIAWGLLTMAVAPGVAAASGPESTTITRDQWGVAHIHGTSHADAFFGMGYAQAEDYFWQLEDTCIQALGRYAEIMGEDGIRSDIQNRSFEIPRRSREDFGKLSPEHQDMATAFAEGVNRYLQTHPEEKPRLITHFEPWYVMAMDRHMLLHFIYRQAHIGKPQNRSKDEIAGIDREPEAADDNVVFAWDVAEPPDSAFSEAVRAAIGSNAWAISGTKTRSGRPMLFINPHQPWYGMGQFYEVHVSSGDGLNFTGACFFGNPFPTIGHNEHLGWTYTVNEPDIADAWQVSFDHPEHPLNYRYGDGYRSATQWVETLKVKRGDKLVDQQVTFRKTHHGPIVRKQNDRTYLAAQVAGLFSMERVDQAWGMVLARNFSEWRTAISRCAIPMFNVVYADQAGNIFYAYNGTIPVRDPAFNWQRPVDGSNPKTDWQGIHTFDELPQVLNPSAGYVQSCNSAPFTTTHVNADNPQKADFPNYMVEDAHVDMRRSRMSRMILQDASELDLQQLQQLAYDTRMYWPMTEIPALQADYRRLTEAAPDLAREIEPYWKHLLNWDCECSIECTQATLMVAWYEELYGFGYPAETLKPEYANDRLSWFRALRRAAEKISSLYGTWKHPWGQAHRLQRVADQPDVEHAGVGLNSFFNSLPCPGAPGPLGIIFTVYSSPEIPLIRPQRFAVVGASYMAVAEFQDRVTAYSVMPFGANGRRRSPHFFDQAPLYASKKLKPAWFYPDEVEQHAAKQISLSRQAP
ncbi:MAG: penicillin acylase family protein [Fuerstiella sp.]